MTIQAPPRRRSDEMRRARRAFVSDHHPDRGGDPADFIAGLAQFDRTGAGPEVVFVRSPRGVARLYAWLRAQHHRPSPPRVL